MEEKNKRKYVHKAFVHIFEFHVCFIESLKKRPEYSVSHSGEEWERVMARSRRDFLKQHTSNLMYILSHNLKDCWHSCTLISQFGSFLLSLATIHKPPFRSAIWCTKLPSLWPSPPRTLQRPHLTTWQGVLFETIPAQGSLFPLSPLFPPWGPFGRGRELRWPHCADCSPAWARCIPENWARLLLLLHNIPFYFVRFRHQLRSRRPRTLFHASRPNGQRSSFKKEKTHSNKFLRHEWWRWRCQCVTLKRATSMAIAPRQILLPFEWVVCSSPRECILFIGSEMCLQPTVVFFATAHWRPPFLSPKVPASRSHVSYSTWRRWPPCSSGECCEWSWVCISLF